MSRCRCCDVEMQWRDFKMIQDDGREEDMCSTCLSIAYSPESCDSHHYQFQEITESFTDESITKPKDLND